MTCHCCGRLEHVQISISCVPARTSHATTSQSRIRCDPFNRLPFLVASPFQKKYHPIDRYLAKGVTISTVGRSLGRVACTTCSAFLGGSKFPVSRYSQHQKDKTGRMTKLFQHHLLPPFFHLSITCCHTHTHTRGHASQP